MVQEQSRFLIKIQKLKAGGKNQKLILKLHNWLEDQIDSLYKKSGSKFKRKNSKNDLMKSFKMRSKS